MSSRIEEDERKCLEEIILTDEELETYFDIKMNKNGSIYLLTGGMCSGKSGALYVTLRKCFIGNGNKNTILIRYDNEDSNLKTSRDGIDVPSDLFTYVKGKKGLTIDFAKHLLINGVKTIGIDEGQFFEGLNRFCDVLQKFGIVVYVAALNGDWERKPWKEVSNLIPYVTGITHHNAVCKGQENVCGRQAIYSKRLTDSRQLEVIEKDFYEAVCNQHY